MSQKKNNKTLATRPSEQKKGLAAERQKSRLFYLIIISVLVLLLYLPTLNYKFTNNDDVALIKDNYEFLKDPSNIPVIFKQSVFFNTFKVTDIYYRPVLTLSYFIDTQIAGKHYWFFYLTDILLHLACCMLFFTMLQKLQFDRTRSFLFTALFSVHFALPQAIAWLPGRNDTLLALFALSSFIFLIEYCNRKKTILLFFHLLLLLTALFTKESALFLPPVFLLYILLWRDKKIHFTKQLKENKWPILLWILLIIFTMMVRRSVLHDTVGMSMSYTITNFILNLPAIVQYIGKMMIPMNLSSMPVMEDVPLYYGIIVILLLSFFIWRTKEKNYRRIFFGLSWMLIFLAPSILRTSTALETLFLEHRLYIPIIGFFLIWAETDLVKKFTFNNRTHLVLFSSVVLLFFTTAWIHREDYKNPYNYWKSASEGSPHSSAALRGMAAYYMENKQVEKAEKLYLRCLEINPDITEVRNNLGRIMMDRGDTVNSRILFLEEIEMNPLAVKAYYNLGHLYFSQERYEDAERMFRKSLKLDNSDIVVKNDLAACLAMQGKYEESMELCIDILEKYPDYEYPKNYIRQIFGVWEDEEKAAFYKTELSKKNISY